MVFNVAINLSLRLDNKIDTIISKEKTNDQGFSKTNSRSLASIIRLCIKRHNFSLRKRGGLYSDRSYTKQRVNISQNCARESRTDIFVINCQKSRLIRQIEEYISLVIKLLPE